MACAKDNANECLTLLDSIRILDSLLITLSPEAALPPPEDSLQKNLPPSSLDMATRINLWEKRAVTLRTLKREEESIKQFKFLWRSINNFSVNLKFITCHIDRKLVIFDFGSIKMIEL